jgi:chromate transporter
MSDATAAPPATVAASGATLAPHGRVRPRLGEFLRACLVLGATGFGGGLAILSQAGEIFERKRWLTDREWVHTATVAQLLPGGAATNALAYVGLRFYGSIGAAAAVGVYVAPSAAAMITLALFYQHIHSVRGLDALLAGFNAAVVGLVVGVTWKLGQGGLKRGWQAVLAALALAVERLGDATVLEVIVFGIMVGIAADSLQKGWRLRERRKRRRRDEDGALTEPPPPGGEEGEHTEDPLHPGQRSKPPQQGPGPGGSSLKAFFLPFAAALSRDALRVSLDVWSALGAAAVQARAAPDAEPRSIRGRGSRWMKTFWGALSVPLSLALFFTFARVGAVAYGGGFTIVPLLEREAVERNNWITSQEFADAIAFGQVTPGPVLIAASFIGARADGIMGGLAATIGVPVLLTITAGAWLDRWRRSRWVKAALRGLVPAVVGMMAAAAIALAKAGIPDETGIILAVVALVAVLKYRVNPAVVVMVTGVVRALLSLLPDLRV